MTHVFPSQFIQSYDVKRHLLWNRIVCNVTRVLYTEAGSEFLTKYSTHDPYDHAQSRKIVIGPYRLYVMWKSRMLILQIKRPLSLIQVDVQFTS
jgi:hypothetical protein